MKIMDILVEGALALDLAAEDKPAALEEMAGKLAAAEPSVEKARLLEVLSEREKLQSTGIGDGVAIPHGKIPGLQKLMAAFARSRRGVAFDSIDGKPTHLFFLLVVPEHAGDQHLKALARISRFFRDAAFREGLLKADSAEALLEIIAREDARA